MLINLPYLVVGILLLWFPRQAMRLGQILGRRRRSSRRQARSEPWNQRAPDDPRLVFREEFTKPRNYFDLLRGLAGAIAIVGGYGIQPALAVAEGAARSAGTQVLALKLAILLVAILAQAIRYEHRRVSFFAPVFFVAGMSVPLCGHWPALFAFALVWAVNAIFANAQAFMSGYALLLALFGLLFRDASQRLVIAAGLLCFLPVLLSLLARRRLGVFTRKGTR